MTNMNTPEKVWLEYHSRLRAFIKSKILDDAAADDILQDVFLKMHLRLDSLKGDAKLQSWLYQIARNTIIDYYRSRKPSEELPERLSQPNADTGEKALQELADCLNPMIQRLPVKYREAVMLSELKGMTQREVAKMQGVSVSGAKSRVQRGRALLKEMLTDCCLLEYDHKGRLCDYEQRDGSCDVCRPPYTGDF